MIRMRCMLREVTPRPSPAKLRLRFRWRAEAFLCSWMTLGRRCRRSMSTLWFRTRWLPTGSLLREPSSFRPAPVRKPRSRPVSSQILIAAAQAHHQQPFARACNLLLSLVRSHRLAGISFWTSMIRSMDSIRDWTRRSRTEPMTKGRWTARVKQEAGEMARRHT